MRCKELRARARETLGHKIFGSAWLYALLILLIVAALEGFSAITIIGAIILMGPLAYGSTKIFTRAARNETNFDNLGMLFDGFKENAARNIIANLLMLLFEFLWSLLLIVPGIIKSYSYAMTNYILTDDPNIEANDAITKSRVMMVGNKWRLFCLDLSFIGWYIVGALCFGVGVLWVDAYHSMARAHFYEDLKSVVVVK